jgi:lactate permease
LIFGLYLIVENAVLGYDPTTSFSLLSVPITLPAEVSAGIIGPPGINAFEFAFKISLFLPLISTGFAFAILWLMGENSPCVKARFLQ